VRTQESDILAKSGRGNGCSLATIVAIAMALALLAVCTEAQSSAKPATADSPSGDVKHGQQLYTSSGCYQCHGREGQGSRYSGARIGPPPISLSGFTEYIRQPAGQMPPYTRKVLSDAEVADIYAFLKSVPQPPPAKSIPLLSD
jgi:ubiquinol-cytochrome c reductase cytochrome c subunit